MEIIVPKLIPTEQIHVVQNLIESKGYLRKIERCELVYSVSHGAPDFCRCRKFNEPRTNISGSVTTHSRKQTAHAKSCIPRDGGGCFVPGYKESPAACEIT